MMNTKNEGADNNSASKTIYSFDNFFKISADLICIAGFDGILRE